MAKFTYIAKKGDSETYRGTAEARDRFELYQIVRREGGSVVSVTEQGKAVAFSFDRMFGRIKEYEKILFARNLSAMLSAGLNLPRALAVLARQTSNKKLGEVLGEIDSALRKGEPFNVAISHFPKVFPSLFVSMIRAGEESGELSGALATVAEQTERMYDLKRKVRSAMIYPCIVLVAIVGIGILMMIIVVPTLAETFKAAHATLPGATRAVIAVSDALAHNTIQTLGSMFGSVALVIYGFRTKKGAVVLDWIAIHMPLISGLTKEINAARTARTMASLVGAGVGVIQSLEITKEVVQNSFYKDVIQDAIVQVNAGKPLSVGFASHSDLYPPFVSEMMAVGEETGATTDMLKRLALYYEDQVDRQTKDMSTIIEPFLMLFIGAAVGFFAVAMIMPIYQLTASAG
ncbi:MAG: hypothetical protein JWO50_452 [Candidatus Kaiserbacteria bacterium]|nr:hypothetical protein [Candidatus Kaiserbacteria bacterium]